uniref:Chymotrypsin-like serine protease 4 n=1 Tax=Antheraea yamamai TaxID=7121 RepID=A0A1B1LTR9_ANTYA|nr:chymotrypsin-like serine protease 4 [Antheraea yamamai]
MRVFLLLGLAAVATVSAHVEVNSFYHETYGIPEAQRIKDFEDKIIASRNAQEDQKIVGGAVAPTNAHPYLGGLIISLLNIAGNSVCGSTLVSHNRLVTAAHCWFDGRNQAWQFTVVLGSSMLFSGGTRIATTNVVVHPQWLPSMLLNDVAVIYLPTNVFFSSSIQAIALPNPSELSETFVGQWGVAAGYGRTSDQQVGVTVNTVVSQVNLQVISVAQCQAVFGVFAQPSNICTSGSGGVGICSGDSGGPLVVNRSGQNILVGISSFVAANGCQLGFPSAFARVTSFYNFIHQNM